MSDCVKRNVLYVINSEYIELVFIFCVPYIFSDKRQGQSDKKR